MAEVAYLFGAGASAECVPVVSEMGDFITDLIIKADQALKRSTYNDLTKDYEEYYLNNFLENKLNTLKIQCDNHFSIDTYAKKLYLTNRKAFNQLKNDLCFFFTLSQIVGNIDRRYDNFFSSILTTRGRLPNKITVLSWNYDFQLEQSYREFCRGANLNDVRSKLNTISCADLRYMKIDAEGFSVIKLNGSARIHNGRENDFLISTFEDNTDVNVLGLVRKYKEMCDKDELPSTELKFAWENENYSQLFSECSNKLEIIEVLVVIGYSFPFFNREVDASIFKNLPNLKKVYIQDLNPTKIQETMEEFVEFKQRKIEIIHKINLTQFVFPKELDVT